MQNKPANMDHWNMFGTPASEPTMVDFNRSISSNPSLNRYNSMNGHGGTNNGIGLNSSNINPYGSSMPGSNSSMNSSNPSLNLHNTINSHTSMSNMTPYANNAAGNTSVNSYNSGVGGSNGSSSIMNPYNTNGGLNSNGGLSPYNLNTSMPPPASSRPPHMPSSNGYNQHQPPPQSRNRGYNYYDQSGSGQVNASGGGGGGGRSPPFPPPPAAAAAAAAAAGRGGGNNTYYGGATNTSNMYDNSSSHNMYHHQQPRPIAPAVAAAAAAAAAAPVPPQQSTTNYYSDNSTTSSNNSAFPPIGEFKIGTFTLGSNGLPTEGNGSDSTGHSFNGSTANGSSTNGSSDPNQTVRETGIIEKLLQTYGFIQCCERQARLFFHFSQFDGNTDHLRIGDPVEFEVTFDRRTGKPIASSVLKISPEVVLGEERVVGAVTTALHNESGGGETQGRISYENRGECFFLPYGKDDVEGYVTLKPGDKVSFQMATNQRTGNLAARHVRLENPVAPVRYQGVVCAIVDTYGLIERADVVDEICYYVSETKHIPGGLKPGDEVDFCITTQESKEVAIELVKLEDGSVVFEDTSQEFVRGQVLKTVERSPRHNAKEPLPGRIRYRGGKDRSEVVEVKFGERDQRGEFTLRHGDWVEFNIATDRRDRLQKATNISLLDDSFGVSGERREQGVVHLLSKECGHILCCERDLLLHFHYRELLMPTLPVSVGDEVILTISQDTTLTGPNKQTATRIAHLEKGTAMHEVFVQANLHGQLSSVAGAPPPLVAPEAPGSVVPPKEVLGTITYLVEGQRHSMDYAYHEDVAQLNAGDKVSFSVFFSKRLKKLIATKVCPMTTAAAAAAASSSAISSADATAASNTITYSPTAAASSDQQQQCGAVSGVLDVSTTNSSGSTELLETTATESCNGLDTSMTAVAQAGGGDASPSAAVSSKKGSGQKNSNKQPRTVYQGFIAALKESFGFVETVNHDKEIFFHFSNIENIEPNKLELGDEVEYTLSSRTGPGGKVSAENITPLTRGTLPIPKALDAIYNGLVIRPIRSSNPDQSEYCGLLAVDTDDVDRSEQYKFGITGVINKRELLQKGDSVTFQVDETGWATNIIAVRKKLIATVDTVKGQYGFLNYEAEEGKKLFFHQTEVKDKATLSAGDEVEFVIITNQKTGKSSACSIARILPSGGQTRRPLRLISQLKTMSLDQSKPRIIVMRQPKGPDGSKGFTFVRDQLTPALLA